ncbi:MAG: DUF3859 domain-containing protein [Elusimicrobia bacterium]|nr:DUF3859 domain-containing protein [Elusimicrobiota bacterium]
MNRTLGISLAAVLLALYASASRADVAAPKVDKIEIVEAGIYKVEVASRERVDGLAGGKLSIVKNSTLLKATTTIPMKIGTTFGIRYKVIGSPDGSKAELKIVTNYPKEGVRDPGQKRTLYASTYPVNKTIGLVTYKSYTLEEGWELVPGRWSFEVWYGDKKMAEQEFTIVAQ